MMRSIKHYRANWCSLLAVKTWSSKKMNSIINTTAMTICILVTSFSQADCNYIGLDDFTNVDDYKTPSNLHELFTKIGILPRKTSKELKVEFSDFEKDKHLSHLHHNTEILDAGKHNCKADGLAEISYSLSDEYPEKNIYPYDMNYCITFDKKISYRQLTDEFVSKYGEGNWKSDGSNKLNTMYSFNFDKDGVYSSSIVIIKPGGNGLPPSIKIEYKDSTFYAQKQLKCEEISEKLWESQKVKYSSPSMITSNRKGSM
jgi:hypothetical protein